MNFEFCIFDNSSILFKTSNQQSGLINSMAIHLQIHQVLISRCFMIDEIIVLRIIHFTLVKNYKQMKLIVLIIIN